MNSIDDEILACAQEKKGNDEFEDAITQNGTSLAVGLGALFTVILVIVKYVITKEADFGITAVMAFIAGIDYYYSGRQLKIKKNTVEGIFWLMVSVACTVIYIGGML